MPHLSGDLPIALRYRFFADDQFAQDDTAAAAEFRKLPHLLRIVAAGGDQQLVERLLLIDLPELPAAAEHRKAVDMQSGQHRVVVDDFDDLLPVAGFLRAIQRADENPAVESAAVNQQPQTVRRLMLQIELPEPEPLRIVNQQPFPDDQQHVQCRKNDRSADKLPQINAVQLRHIPIFEQKQQRTGQDRTEKQQHFQPAVVVDSGPQPVDPVSAGEAEQQRERSERAEENLQIAGRSAGRPAGRHERHADQKKVNERMYEVDQQSAPRLDQPVPDQPGRSVQFDPGQLTDRDQDAEQQQDIADRQSRMAQKEQKQRRGRESAADQVHQKGGRGLLARFAQQPVVQMVLVTVHDAAGIRIEQFPGAAPPDGENHVEERNPDRQQRQQQRGRRHRTVDGRKPGNRKNQPEERTDGIPEENPRRQEVAAQETETCAGRPRIVQSHSILNQTISAATTWTANFRVDFSSRRQSTMLSAAKNAGITAMPPPRGTACS